MSDPRASLRSYLASIVGAHISQAYAVDELGLTLFFGDGTLYVTDGVTRAKVAAIVATHPGLAGADIDVPFERAAQRLWSRGSRWTVELPCYQGDERDVPGVGCVPVRFEALAGMLVTGAVVAESGTITIDVATLDGAGTITVHPPEHRNIGWTLLDDDQGLTWVCVGDRAVIFTDSGSPDVSLAELACSA